jgi:hypothetical protein
MDEVSSHVRLDLPLSDGKADPKIVPPRPRIPCWKGLGADSEEKREPVSDIDTAVVDSLKTLDPNRPMREADIRRPSQGREDRAQPLQDAARALPSASSMMRRMVRAQRPHWALQPRQP